MRRGLLGLWRRVLALCLRLRLRKRPEELRPSPLVRLLLLCLSVRLSVSPGRHGVCPGSLQSVRWCAFFHSRTLLDVFGILSDFI